MIPLFTHVGSFRSDRLPERGVRELTGGDIRVITARPLEAEIGTPRPRTRLGFTVNVVNSDVPPGGRR